MSTVQVYSKYMYEYEYVTYLSLTVQRTYVQYLYVYTVEPGSNNHLNKKSEICIIINTNSKANLCIYKSYCIQYTVRVYSYT